MLALPIIIFLTAFKNDIVPGNKKGDPSIDNNKSPKNVSNYFNTGGSGSPQFELNPNVISFVDTYLSKESYDLKNLKKRAEPYFEIYEKILSAYDLPVELKYLSVIESGLQSQCVSSQGAVGPWQIMPDEAKRFGLKITDDYDERTSFKKSTVVAAKILKELYDDLGDWLLVIAAYNAGEGRVRRAISKANSRNFWEIQDYLPAETRNHVKKYIATHYFFEGSGGWTTLTAEETLEKRQMLSRMYNRLDSIVATANIRQMQIVGKYNAVCVAEYLSMDLDEFNKLNPEFDKRLSEGQLYNIRLPLDKMEIFEDKRQIILQQSVETMLSGSLATNK